MSSEGKEPKYKDTLTLTLAHPIPMENSACDESTVQCDPSHTPRPKGLGAAKEMCSLACVGALKLPNLLQGSGSPLSQRSGLSLPGSSNGIGDTASSYVSTTTFRG